MTWNEPERTGTLAAAVGEARRRVNISRLVTLKGQTCALRSSTSTSRNHLPVFDLGEGQACHMTRLLLLYAPWLWAQQLADGGAAVLPVGPEGRRVLRQIRPELIFRLQEEDQTFILMMHLHRLPPPQGRGLSTRRR